MSNDALRNFPPPISPDTVGEVLSGCPLVTEYEKLKRSFPSEEDKKKLDEFAEALKEATAKNKKVDDLWTVISSAKRLTIQILGRVIGA